MISSSFYPFDESGYLIHQMRRAFARDLRSIRSAKRDLLRHGYMDCLRQYAVDTAHEIKGKRELMAHVECLTEFPITSQTRAQARREGRHV